ncbi:MAG: hypothetical protein J6S85_11125 [Methanobrevibacter sp.]|nr:hypothetical protein [Methanobrevibacter sp.]
MITSGFSLAFNNKALLNNSKEMLWQRNIYQLTTNRVSANKNSGYAGETVEITSNSPAWNEKFSSYSITGATLTGNTFTFTNSDVTAKANYETAKNVTTTTNGHGTVTATPKSGFIGTQVTLTNTPNSGYDFVNYSITGATLTDNNFTFMNSDVTVQANFSSNAISSVYWYKTEAATVAAGNTTTIPINTEITDFNYCTVKFQHQGVIKTVWAHDFWLNFNNFSWKARTHYTAGDYKGVREGGTFTAANNYVKSKTVDSRTLRYYISIAETTDATYKFVLDRSANSCSAFLNNTYLGYGNDATGITSLNSIQIASEVGGTVTTKEHYVAGFKNLSDAVAW